MFCKYTYSNWEYVHLCHSESFEALSTGLQDALHHGGGVPRRVRSDSLSAAVNNLSNDKEFASQYEALLSHYGLQGHRINVQKPHENGDVESSHGHLKTAVDQALRLRGNRDFTSAQDLMAFIEQGKDLGAIQLVASSSACDTAVRDASQRRLPGPEGQPAYFRKTRFGSRVLLSPPPLMSGAPSAQLQQVAPTSDALA